MTEPRHSATDEARRRVRQLRGKPFREIAALAREAHGWPLWRVMPRIVFGWLLQVGFVPGAQALSAAALGVSATSAMTVPRWLGIAGLACLALTAARLVLTRRRRIAVWYLIVAFMAAAGVAGGVPWWVMFAGLGALMTGTSAIGAMVAMAAVALGQRSEK
ncbi:MAG: hypothetical protein ACREL5_03745 [Gemmatimonadales bacterium]